MANKNQLHINPLPVRKLFFYFGDRKSMQIGVPAAFAALPDGGD